MTRDEVIKELKAMHSYFYQFENNGAVRHCEALNTAIRIIENIKLKNITASSNGLAVGEVYGGLVINRQEANEIHNIKNIEVFNG